MSDPLYHAALLAQRSRLEYLQDRFEGRRIDAGDVVTGLLILVGLVVAAWLLSVLLNLQERRKGRNSSFRLFISLCKAHRLRWSQWWLQGIRSLYRP